MSESKSSNSPLGKSVEYVAHYSPDLLCAIDRQASRESLGIRGDILPFNGEDVWNAYELSWLDPGGKPVVACGEFRIPSDSPAIVESKSFKLYLNSFNQSSFDSAESVQQALQRDLSATVGAPIQVCLNTAGGSSAADEPLQGECLDQLAVACSDYQPRPALLKLAQNQQGQSVAKAVVETVAGTVVEQCYYSHLLRSLCPVTGQPDWGTVIIEYRGPAIDPHGLLQYIVSYREHQDYHEHCVEQMFVDIMQRCSPQQLTVHARYLRRGGLDINPYRSTELTIAPNSRTNRQ